MIRDLDGPTPPLQRIGQDPVSRMRFLQARVEADGYRVVLAEAPVPSPRPDEVLVRVEASGLNRADLSQIAGRYPPPPGEPEILGLELSGVVEETGEKVCALVAGGAHAEYAAVPRGQILPAPASLGLREAAAIPEAFLTAFLNLAVEGNLAAGKAALIHAGASGVGLAAIQTAKLLGARAAATTRTAAKLPALTAAGADLAIDTSKESFAEAIERAWGADAIDVALDPVGAGTLGGDLRVLAAGGRILILASMSGARAELELGTLLGKHARIIGSTLRSCPRPQKAGLIFRFRREILPAFESGGLKVSIDSIFPPDRAAEAFSRMKENLNVGKILIDWSRRSGAARLAD
jgi:putative PIG3 family NAD(P)H quinone oxidoreductase